MANGIWVANPGINALTDTNPKNFSLFADGTLEHILVKEQSRGTNIVASGATGEVTHSLGHAPFALAQVEVSSGEFETVFGNGAYNVFSAYADTNKFYLKNLDVVSRPFTYIIFYDQI